MKAVKKKPIYKRWWFWVLILAALASRITSGKTAEPKATEPPTRAALVESSPAPSPEPTAELLLLSTPEPSPDPTPEPTPTPAPLNTYVLNTSSGKFHWPSCKSVSKMKDSNKMVIESTRADMIAAGYSPCGQCKP